MPISPPRGCALMRALRESHNEACGETQERNSILPETAAWADGWIFDMFRIVELFGTDQRVCLLLC